MGVGLCRTVHPGDQMRFRTVGEMNGVIEMPRKERCEDDTCREDNSGFCYAGSPATV